VTTKTTLAVAAALLLAAAPSFGQQADDDQALQQQLSRLRACVRSNAAEVYALGIRATHDAEKMLLSRCNPLNELFASIKFSELNERVTSNLRPVPPGIFRITAREEWAAFLGSASGK